MNRASGATGDNAGAPTVLDQTCSSSGTYDNGGVKQKSSTLQEGSAVETVAKEPRVSAASRPSVIPSLYCGGKRQLVLQRRVRQEAVPWVWAPFTNPSRSDMLELNHWIKGEDVGKVYPFYKFNKKLSVPSYTCEEYRNLLHIPGSSWSKEKTDYLFHMCKTWDLRWPVICDRWEGDLPSLESMKKRYYDVCRKLESSRAGSSDFVDKSGEQFEYDAENERMRRRQLEIIFKRTRVQAFNDQSVAVDYKKLEEQLKEREKERITAKKLVTVLEAKLTAKGLASSTSSGTKGDKSPKRKKKKVIPAVTGLDSVRAVLSTGGALNSDGSAMNEAPIVESFAGIEKPFLSEEVLKVRKEKSSGTYMRSTKAAVPISSNSKVQKKIDGLLVELGVGLNPMATGPVMRLFDDVRGNIFLLLELKKHVKAREYELNTLKFQNEELKKLAEDYEPLSRGKEEEIAFSVEKIMNPDVSFMAQFLKKEKLSKKMEKDGTKIKEKKVKQSRKKKEKEGKKSKHGREEEASESKPAKKTKAKKDKTEPTTDIEYLIQQMKEEEASTPKKKGPKKLKSTKNKTKYQQQVQPQTQRKYRFQFLIAF